jgi:hypothetical protein
MSAVATTTLSGYIQQLPTETNGQGYSREVHLSFQLAPYVSEIASQGHSASRSVH